MFLRKITQETAISRSPEEVIEDIRQAFLRIGKVKSVDDAARTVKGTVRCGGWVTLEVAVSPAEGGSQLSLIGRCDDIWGYGARRGIKQMLDELGHSPSPDPPGAGVAAIKKKVDNLEENLTLAQKITLVLFLALTSMASLDVAWKRGLFPLSLTWLYLLAASAGAFTGWMVIKSRYRIAGVIGGAVAGFCAVGFSVFVFAQSTYTYKLVAICTTILGCLPGVAVVLGLRWIQDRLFPPPRDQKPST